MHISLKNKKALVGGSTQGIGKAIALQLASSGAIVTLMARNEEKLKQLVQQLPCPEKQEHQYLTVDFLNFDSYQKIISNYFEEQSIDILVNNTQGPSAGTAFEKSPADYQQAFDLLFQTLCFTTMKAVKKMQAQTYGRIINVSSVTVKEPIQSLVLSNTIRSAVISFAKTLAKDVAADNITVNNILTGYFDTERLNELITIQAKNAGLSIAELKTQKILEVPMKRLGRPEEFANLVAFLASDLASYITGTSIPIDGGRLISI